MTGRSDFTSPGSRRSEYQRNIDRRVQRLRELLIRLSWEVTNLAAAVEKGNYIGAVTIADKAVRIDQTLAELETLEDAKEALEADSGTELVPPEREDS